MKNLKGSGRIIGFIFLSTCIAYILGALLLQEFLNAADPLLLIGENSRIFALAVLLELSCAIGIAGIPIVLHPLVDGSRKHLNLAYLGCRLWEGGVILLFSVFLMLIVNSDFPGLFSQASALYSGVNDIWIPLTLGMGGIFFNTLLRKERLVNPFFSWWGLGASILVMAGGILEAFQLHLGTYLALPVAAFEFIFSVYLLIFGFTYKTKQGDQND